MVATAEKVPTPTGAYCSYVVGLRPSTYRMYVRQLFYLTDVAKSRIDISTHTTQGMFNGLCLEANYVAAVSLAPFFPLHV